MACADSFLQSLAEMPPSQIEKTCTAVDAPAASMRNPKACPAEAPQYLPSPEKRAEGAIPAACRPAAPSTGRGRIVWTVAVEVNANCPPIAPIHKRQGAWGGKAVTGGRITGFDRSRHPGRYSPACLRRG